MQIMTITVQNEKPKYYRITDEETETVKRFLNISIDDYDNNLEMLLDDNKIDIDFKDITEVEDF